MSCSKPLPQFVFDLLYYLNRDQLERCTIVCRPLKNFIERYLYSKPYRVFDRLDIYGSSPSIRGSYALYHNHVQWHPNRDDYSAQQFLGMDDLENWLYDDAADVFDRDRAILEDEEQNGVRPSQSCMDVADEISAIPARESLSLEAVGASKAKRKSYTIARKLEVVDFALKVKSIHSASKKYNIDRKTIGAWMEKEKQLRITEASTVRGGQKKNLPGAGPPLKDEMFDKRLAAWVRDNRNLGIKVTRSMMVDKAQKMFQPVFGPETETTFNASHGWLEKFIARHGFGTREETRRCQKLPSEYADKIVDFINYVSNMRKESNSLSGKTL